MTSWINDRNHERRLRLGIAGSLSQDHHEAVNRRYPGLTREHCWLCAEETGRAGRGEDSIYDRDNGGPYCLECYQASPARFDE